MPFQNEQVQYQPQNGIAQGMANALQMYMMKQRMQTPAPQVSPDQASALGQTANQFMQGAPSQFMQPSGLFNNQPMNPGMVTNR